MQAISVISKTGACKRPSQRRSSLRNRASVARERSERRIKIVDARRSQDWPLVFFSPPARIGLGFLPSPEHSCCLFWSLRGNRAGKYILLFAVGASLASNFTHSRASAASSPRRQRHRRRRRRFAGNTCGAANRQRHLHFSSASFAVRVRGLTLDQACRSTLARGEKKKRGAERGCRAGGREL